MYDTMIPSTYLSNQSFRNSFLPSSSDGAQEILEAYYTTIGGKPTLKAKGKRTRDSTGTPQTQSSGKGSKRIKQVDTNMEDARSTPETDTKGNWKPPAGSWEDDIHCVDTIEMDKNDLYVYLQWNNGRKTRHQTREVYKKCPMRVSGLEPS